MGYLMPYVFLIFIAPTAFIFGFSVGKFFGGRNFKRNENKRETVIFGNEYENFLNYNGEDMP